MYIERFTKKKRKENFYIILKDKIDGLFYYGSGIEFSHYLLVDDIKSLGIKIERW